MIETGYNPFTENPLLAEDNQMDVEKYFGEGNTFLCCLVGEFQGKALPMMCQWSGGGGISGEILTNILKMINTSGVLDRSQGVMPFLLVDAHASRFSLEFLRYINYASHPWRICISVPYGTHKWQVDDSKELNEELNMIFTTNKEDLLQKKSHHGMEPNINRLDIIPLHTPVWKAIFRDVKINKKAIAT